MSCRWASGLLPSNARGGRTIGKCLFWLAAGSDRGYAVQRTVPVKGADFS